MPPAAPAPRLKATAGGGRGRQAPRCALNRDLLLSEKPYPSPPESAPSQKTANRKANCWEGGIIGPHHGRARARGGVGDFEVVPRQDGGREDRAPQQEKKKKKDSPPPPPLAYRARAWILSWVLGPWGRPHSLLDQKTRVPLGCSQINHPTPQNEN